MQVPFSFLKISIDNKTNEEEKKYEPSFPAPTYLSIVEIHKVIFSNKAAILTNNCLGLNRETGAVELINQEVDKEMKNMFSQMLLKLGKSFFVSNIQGISAPAMMNEGRSDIDRSIDCMRIVSIYMNKAANSHDKLERMKYLTVGFFASIYLNLRMKKAFNPLLGETCEVTLEDGTKVAVEQVSHHPPISCMYTVGKDNSFIHSSIARREGQFKLNYLVIKFGITANITFKDGHKIKIITTPAVKINGLMQGTRHSYFKGYYEAVDLSSNLRSVVYIDFGKKKHYIGSSKTHTRDKIEGLIYESTDINTPCNPKGCRIEDLTDIKAKKTLITGSIFDRIDCDGVNYWHIDKQFPLKVQFESNPIPSDWRYREDLIYVRRGDYEKAESWKDAIEIRQRRDQKEREKYLALHKESQKK